ncbi:SPOR domain-containing protein [Donghicola mangrovi]|uniref:SPOR domain-containing protein n=1 Tax=Donghicola mangrovi TaxID=2729614 RepID=A0A850QC53_9RHOB|nr:SPOR domain-containing protein [Donghicola mangrovi]NVO23789.1 SPOR domain-containing protein [Donghicola mangrovi]
MARILVKRTLVGIAALSLVAGCMEGVNPLSKKGEGAAAIASGQTSRRVERDVEAPDVFQVSEKGLWDGRPSLGGVWVAHPDVKEPERVIIRNESNGSFVIGALFRRERANAGPRLEVSSDAAAALGLLAGAPADITVTALRREENAEPEAEAVIADAPMAEGSEIAAPEAVETATLDPIAAAEAAIDAPAPVAAAPVPAKSDISKPYVQLGIFSVQANADRTADKMRKIGLTPEVHESSIKGKTFWRVVVGPAMTAAERADILAKVKAEGFADAYSVTD